MFFPKVSLGCVEKILHIILTIEESNAVGCSFVVSQKFPAIRLLDTLQIYERRKKKKKGL